MDSLKPCPFCGNKVKTIDEWLGSEAIWSIECAGQDCHLEFKFFADLKELIAAWNRRTYPGAVEGWAAVDEDGIAPAWINSDLVELQARINQYFLEETPDYFQHKIIPVLIIPNPKEKP